MTGMNQFDNYVPVTRNPGSSAPRPLGVTLLALGVLIIAGLNLVRFILAISRWQFLSDLPGVSPLYLALTGLIWGVVGIPLFWSLWRGLSLAPRLMQAVLLTYAAYYWLDRIFLEERMIPNPQESLSAFLPLNWPFTITITVLLMLVTVWILSRPHIKAFFGEQHE
jgi:hypothetical protein